ncbi:hypothetical protein NELLIE_44 [Arthrobacter phage Nellie]|uniref:Uncharacterized protein n=4 Tax=Jasminevirus adat TaxID=2560299 RepID=A0A249XN88_9CAUD|nr:hypothetical protein FDI47_gp44 [Arthrobacter phage Adat]ASZ72616.1 hypothetical protein ADAT_44 [Arthrobacter phage Adat]ASZ73197.1 hypothetical protein GURGLEFERB_44 [Arthrobacter phage GurgleFerb]ASZ73762.1 hypothetical protein NELLIE_44 [Arthrobacter phage Nellie]AXH43732.1 hypothetical protein SEA_BRAD_44 [Arthrobacter phage Brad]
MPDLIEKNKFMGGKVFLAVRPKLFQFNSKENQDNQHVTMEYIGTLPSLWDLLQKIDEWEEKLNIAVPIDKTQWHMPHRGMPCMVRVNGYANWYNSNNDKERYFDVALVEFPWNKEIGWDKNWHVTLGKSDRPVLPRQFDPSIDGQRVDYLDTLWIGFKTKDGESKWLSADGFRELYKQWDESHDQVAN